MKKVKVSVVTPAYNAEKFLPEAIESILNQSYQNFEYIVIDDCSIDKTRKIIQHYGKKDKRIIAVSNEKNLGIAGNRNKGVSLAKGEYLIWQDADDISLPRRIERQVAFMDRHPKVGICGGFLQFFDQSGLRERRKYASDDKTLRSKIFRYSPVAQPAAIIRKKCLDEAGEYDLNYPPAEDIDMSFRIGRKYHFANLQETVIYYREHLNSATFRKLKIMELNTLKIRRKYVKGWGYKMTLADTVYNILQFYSIFIIPPKWKIWLFNKIRNS